MSIAQEEEVEVDEFPVDPEVSSFQLHFYSFFCLQMVQIIVVGIQIIICLSCIAQTYMCFVMHNMKGEKR